MFESFKILFLMFITYSFFGWCMECIYMKIEDKILTNRGFFIGPYCPLYGFGAVLMSLFLQKFENNIVGLFFLAVVICTILEYLTGYVLEKIFDARWWDYSDEPFNINGRVCLKTMFYFGILGVLMIKFLNPTILKFYNNFSASTFNIMFYVIAIIFFSDVVVSIYILIRIKKEGKLIKKEKDNSMEMSKKVRETLKSLSYPYRRLLSSFPNIRYIKNTIKEKSIKILKKGKRKKKQ